MHDVVVYFSSLQKQTPSRKIDVLQAFADGARSQGASVHIETTYAVRPARLAVILGWPSPLQDGPNIRLRQAVVKEQKRTNNHVMAIDASTFKFHDPDGKYLRYSLNGVFYDTAEYANKNSNSTRWNIIKNDLKLEMQPWRNRGNYILLLMQRDGGWSMKGMDPVEWVQTKIHEVRAATNLPIMVRPHPGKKIDLSALSRFNVMLSPSKLRSLYDDLADAQAACVFNSSSGVASILAGVPLVVDDQSSVCWDVALHDINRITQPEFFPRDQWVYDLAACHWSDDESRRGLVYQKFIPYLA
jgi:hypothetical protein